MSEDQIRKFWDEERKKYMITACENVRFTEKIAEKAAEFIDKEDHVCEIGCGLGYLSMDLAGYASKVTAVDADPIATEHLKGLIEKKRGDSPAGKNADNVDVILANAFDLPEDMIFDDVISMSFGHMDETLKFIAKHCRKRGIVIRKNWKKERFTSVREKENDLNSDIDTAALESAGANYRVECITVDMGQPFKSIEDAVEFHKAYNKKFNGITDTKEIEAKLIRKDDVEYPYYLPMERNLFFIIIEREGLKDI